MRNADASNLCAGTGGKAIVVMVMEGKTGYDRKYKKFSTCWKEGTPEGGLLFQ